MRLSTREFNKSVYEAFLLLSKHNIRQPHVPIKQIAESFSIDVIPYYFGDNVSGVLIAKGDVATIGYNPNEPEVRQRFTIAHELGHYVLHRKSKSPGEQLFVDRDFLVKYRSSYKYSEAEYLQEQQANAFAAALLMPESLIHKELRKKEYESVSEIDLIDVLAKLFRVSNVAMTYRLSNLNIDL